MNEREKKLNCILLVDDSRATNLLNKRLILKNGYAEIVSVAVNGDEAIHYLKREGEFQDTELYPMPDLILLDINMPVKNGFEFLEEYQNFKSQISDQAIVVMLTSSILDEEEQKAKDLSVLTFMHKPLTMEKLEDVIELMKAS